MRLAWMDKLRDTVSEFHSILMIRRKLDQEGEEKLSHLGTQIDLLLNREDKIQKELWTYLTKSITASHERNGKAWMPS